MSKEHKDRPRQQYYDFVHHALPEIFFSNPGGLFSSIQKEGDLFLNYLWGKLGEYAQEGQVEIIHSQFIVLDKNEIIKITLPKPEHDHEAHAVIFTRKKEVAINPRYFVFEYRLINSKQINLIGEWIGDTYHELKYLESNEIEDFRNYIISII